MQQAVNTWHSFKKRNKCSTLCWLYMYQRRYTSCLEEHSTFFLRFKVSSYIHPAQCRVHEKQLVGLSSWIHTRKYMNYLWRLNRRLRGPRKRSCSTGWWYGSRYFLPRQMARRWTSCGRGMGCVLARFGTSPLAERTHTAKYDKNAACSKLKETKKQKIN